LLIKDKRMTDDVMRPRCSLIEFICIFVSSARLTDEAAITSKISDVSMTLINRKGILVKSSKIIAYMLVSRRPSLKAFVTESLENRIMKESVLYVSSIVCFSLYKEKRMYPASEWQSALLITRFRRFSHANMRRYGKERRRE